MPKEIAIATYDNEIEASLMAQRLEEYGIPSVVKPRGGGYGVTGQSQFVFHSVYVLEEHAEDAQRIAEGMSGKEGTGDG